MKIGNYKLTISKVNLHRILCAYFFVFTLFILTGCVVVTISDSNYINSTEIEAKPYLNSHVLDNLFYSGDTRITNLSPFFIQNDLDFENGLKAILKNDLESAERHFLAAKEYWASQNNDDAVIAIAKINVCLAEVMFEQSRNEEAYDYLNNAYITFIDEHKGTFEIRSSILKYEIRIGEYDRALRAYQEIVDSSSASAGGSINFILADDLASLFCTMGEYEKAIEVYDLMKEYYPSLLPNNKIQFCANYANALTLAARGDEATAILLEAEKYIKDFRESDFWGDSSSISYSSTVASLYFNLAQTYLHDQEDLDLAKRYIEMALEIEERLNSRSLVSSYSVAIAVYTKRAEYSLAWEYADKGIAASQRIFNDMHNASALLYEKIGYLCEYQGDLDGAIENFNKAILIQKAVLLESTEDTAVFYDGLAMIYIKLGDSDAAYNCYMESGDIYSALAGWDETKRDEYNNIVVAFIEENLA